MSAGGTIAVATISLTDRLKSVRDLLDSRSVIASARIFLGRQYEALEGDGRQITFTPTGMTPSTAVLEMSNREGGSNMWECSAHIWAVNPDDDYGFDQFAALESLLIELQGALRIVAGGRFGMSTIQFADATHVLKYGEHATFSFSFQTNFQMVPATEQDPMGPTTVNAVVRAVS
jgi:hypothetical protein